MPWTLTKSFAFEACHSLPQLPEGHKCRRKHGHSYRVELVLVAASLDHRGFAGGIDYADLDAFGAVLRDHFDHQDLDSVLGAENTTAERIAEYLYRLARPRWDQVFAVRVYETEKTMVEFRE